MDDINQYLEDGIKTLVTRWYREIERFYRRAILLKT